MKEFTVIFRSGNSKKITSPDKPTLIKEHFNNNEEHFTKEVSRLMWSSLSMHYVEDIDSQESHAQITTADVNPYGWRNA